MTLMDWLWAIPVFGILIFIHELGHFSVAKYFGVRVHEFAIGFGPLVYSYKAEETRYSLRLIPLGGFVRMAGMEEAEADDERGFNRQPLLARSLIIAAGPIMNFVLAAVMYSVLLYTVGTLQNTSELGDVPVNCISQDGTSTPCPASAAGLRKGDVVVAIGGQPVKTWREILDIVRESGGNPLLFVVRRGTETLQITLTPVRVDDRWMVGVHQSFKPEPLGRAIVQGPVVAYRLSAAWLEGLTAMVLGKVEPQVAGPVGITREIAEQASRGLDALLQMTAFLSINLGMFNLLPIPALDGSRLVFMVVELVRGRRVDPQRENLVHFVGFLILIGLMLVVTYSEVVRR